jgi:hypothetical protein
MVLGAMVRTADDVPCTLVSHSSQLADLAEAIAGAERIAIDTETPIDGPHAGRMRVMSIAVRSPAGERAFVVDARDVDPSMLAPILSGVTADAWNANFDARVIDAAVWATSTPPMPSPGGMPNSPTPSSTRDVAGSPGTTGLPGLPPTTSGSKPKARGPSSSPTPPSTT